MTKTDMIGESFQRKKMAGMKFENVDLSGSQFDGAEIHNTIFINCDFYWTRFPFAIFSETNFVNCDLAGASFYDASLDNVIFENCNFGKDNLGGSIDMSTVILKDTEFRNCNVDGITGLNLGSSPTSCIINRK